MVNCGVSSKESFIIGRVCCIFMEGKPIVARCIVEILGAPVEFVERSLKDHVDKLKSSLDIQVETYAEPKSQDKLFSQFVELQISFKNVQELLDFCFDSMPSSVEIMSPEVLQIDMTHFEQFLNDFQAKLHHTDMMLKGLQMQKQVLDKNALNIVHNFIKYACKIKSYSMDELAGLVGIKSEDLSAFVDALVSKGALKKEGKLFVANG